MVDCFPFVIWQPQVEGVLWYGSSSAGWDTGSGGLCSHQLTEVTAPLPGDPQHCVTWQVQQKKYTLTSCFSCLQSKLYLKQRKTKVANMDMYIQFSFWFWNLSHIEKTGIAVRKTLNHLMIPLVVMSSLGPSRRGPIPDDVSPPGRI